MGETARKIFLVIMLIILVSLLTFLVYLLYNYIPGEPQSLVADIKPAKLEVENLSYGIEQFYPNMKFNHNSISYKIHSDCSAKEEERAIMAFGELSNQIGIISFYPSSENPDIEVSCSEESKLSVQEDFFIAGEGGAKEIIKTGRYNVITQGVIFLYDSTKGVRCEWPNIELHELLHVFGFEHSQDENSLMYPYLESCEQRLDREIITRLKELYSQENMADLYFDSAEAVKRGIYLDFNVTIKNSGDIGANNVVLTVLDDGKRLKDFNLNDFPFGASIIFKVSYLELNSRGSDNIDFVVDYDNSIREFDEENNFLKLDFSK